MNASGFSVPRCYDLPIDEEALANAVKKTPSWKSVPSHCVPSCVWKGLSSMLVPWLMIGILDAWVDQIPVIPALWRSAWLVLLPKPGKTGSHPKHWRPIGLQEATGKMTLKCLTSFARQSILSSLVCWPQYACIQGRGTADALCKVFRHCSNVRALLAQAKNTIHNRRVGVQRVECQGGMQILIDLQGAFDRAPRSLLQEALLDLPLHPSLISLLLAWHHLTPYHLTHGGHSYVIEGNVGVRQGCVAAPLLWVAFIRLWHKYLSRRFGYEWVIEHLTTYADDHHLAWCFRLLVMLIRPCQKLAMFLTVWGFLHAG